MSHHLDLSEEHTVVPITILFFYGADVGWIRQVCRSFFSKPSPSWEYIAAIKQHKPTSIVELGISDLDVTIRMLETAKKHGNGAPISYTGIDLFDARPEDQTSIGLKQTHQVLAKQECVIRLIPGNPFVGLSRFANSLTQTDLMVISAEVDADALDQSWFFVPRMLSPDAVVFQEFMESKETMVRQIPLDQIQKRSQSGLRQRSVA